MSRRSQVVYSCPPTQSRSSPWFMMELDITRIQRDEIRQPKFIHPGWQRFTGSIMVGRRQSVSLITTNDRAITSRLTERSLPFSVTSRVCVVLLRELATLGLSICRKPRVISCEVPRHDGPDALKLSMSVVFGHCIMCFPTAML